MSLDKAIQHGKEKRKPYRDSRRFDITCRNHGSCPYCANDRQYNKRKVKAAQDVDLQLWLDEDIDKVVRKLLKTCEKLRK